MSHRSPSPFDRLVPVSDRYATLPVADAFTWDACAPEVEPGEWYMVAFRSVRRHDVDEERLTTHDDWAHTEAMGAAGFVHYMSFCLWDSRAEARAAAGRPAHVEAAALTHEAYAEYTLEFHRVTLVAGRGFEFEVYDDNRPWKVVEPTLPLALNPRLAPS